MITMNSPDDLDELMIRFRLASRELFNHFFRVQQPYEREGWALEERFAEVQKVLFEKLVSKAANLSDTKYGAIQHEIVVTLRDSESVPIMVNREIDSGYWDYPVKAISRDAKLLFISFFDWDHLGIRDNRYVRVLIDNWPSCPETVGKHALIDSLYVAFTAAKGASHVP